jgi:hypothetical protein
MKFTTILALFLIASVSMAQGVPNTFTAGTPARAAEVNANFSDLDSRVTANTADITAGEAIIGQLFAEIDFLYVESASAAGVVQSECPVDTIGISANCACDGDGITSNFGVLFGCSIFPEGAVGACFPEAGSFNGALPTSPVTATAVCVSAILVDGSIASTFPIAAGSSPMQKTSTSDVTIEEVAVRYENQLSTMSNARLLKQ